MNNNKWKVIAIIFIILFLLENGLFIIGGIIVYNEEKDIKVCYYEVCKKYPDAYFSDGVCKCYDYDLIGNLVEVDSKLI